MKKIIAYNLFLLIAIIAAACAILKGLLPAWLDTLHVPIFCALVGGVGGITYCLRGVYVNASARKQWDVAWLPWYYIRPIVSIICGAVSYLFLKAGLLVLDAAEKTDTNLLGFYAFAFIAGLNVDKFVSKLEDIAHATWGIEKSRASQNSNTAAAAAPAIAPVGQVAAPGGQTAAPVVPVAAPAAVAPVVQDQTQVS
jgi:hypothetical protein